VLLHNGAIKIKKEKHSEEKKSNLAHYDQKAQLILAIHW
jgi:hypothetical protein